MLLTFHQELRKQSTYFKNVGARANSNCNNSNEGPGAWNCIRMKCLKLLQFCSKQENLLSLGAVSVLRHIYVGNCGSGLPLLYLTCSTTSATPQAVVSNIVSESFYWTTMVLLEALSLILCPKIACITYGVHETVLGRNSPSLNHEDHHLRVDSLTITDAEPRTPRHGKTGRSSRVDWVASQNGSF
ncbi:hypothetical protein CMV_016775 [Castanea mollissima]|uniref:Uncharacterized protein n=1 Tax=Castanea mollissima TaxID=60419 RepID=A0A8J4QTJ7_9ROSI|nr:hypothetical protein CMV_016775 [Castanea mollissima]